VSSLWCEYAWLGGAEAEAGVLVSLDGDRISSVEPRTSARSDSQRLPGLTLPGLANSHSHAFQRALRGRTHGGSGSFWTWREQMYALAGSIDPDGYRALARATFGEMALAGVTVVGEFHYLHHEQDGKPYDDPNAMGHAVLQAASEAGIRITLIDACYLRGGFAEPLDPVQRRFADRDADAWAARVDRLSYSHVAAAIHSVRAVDPESARAVASWTSARSVPLHAHVSEQPAENEGSLSAHGLSPTALLASVDALSERFTAVHATHLTDVDVGLLGDAGVTCCLCPTTERDLADGIGPARRLREAGARLSVGSDSHAVIDVLEEARAIELDERLATGVRGSHTTADLLRAATADGYSCLGWPEGGRIAPGALADLTTVGLDSVRLAGTDMHDAVESVVFAGTAADVRHVMVGGKFIVRDGAHVTLDVPRELAATVGR
jgi:formiminoglutamate deiminase